MQNIVRKEKFIHEGKDYEICLFSSGWDFTVKVYLDGKQANGYSYSVSLPTAFDLRNITGSDAIEVLFERAKNDIQEKNWERYVAAYLQSLNLSEERSVGCRKCTSRDIEIKQVDERKMYRCKTCGNISYEERIVTGPVLMIFDDITESVIKKGYYETHIAMLLNCVFSEEKNNISFWDQLKNWCNQNYLKYEIFYKKSGRKEEQWLRFTRAAV